MNKTTVNNKMLPQKAYRKFVDSCNRAKENKITNENVFNLSYYVIL